MDLTEKFRDAPMNAIENQQLCAGCIESIHYGGAMLDTVPKTLQRIIETRAWEERRIGNGRIVKLNNLRELITTKPPEGWAENPAKIEAIIRDEHEVLGIFRDAMKGKPGRLPKNKCRVNHTALSTMNHRGRAYFDERLEQDRPDLFEQVKNGQLSANAAAIKAGWRKKKTPLQQILHLWQKCTDDEKDEFLNLIRKEQPHGNNHSKPGP